MSIQWMISALAGALLAGAATAQEAKIAARLERLREAADRPADPSVDPGDVPDFDPRGPLNVGSQVNVNAGGANIPGDAANEPSLCIDPTRRNRVAIGWRQFDTIASNFREGGFGYSRDSGRTWTAGVLTNGNFRSDPVLRSNAAGTFYYYSLRTTTACDLFTSTNGGQSWTGPVAAFGGDKAWMTVDTTGGVGNGHIYVHWSEYFGCCTPNVFMRSTNGATFAAPIAYPAANGNVFGTMDIGPGGEVYSTGTFADNFGGNTFVVHRSSTARNAGSPITFDRSVTFDLGGGMGIGTPFVNPAGLLGQAQVVVDRGGGPRNGWVYMMCSVLLGDPNDPLQDPMDNHFVRSSDGGQTWSAPLKIGDDPAGVRAYQWFGTMSVAPNGRLDVVWNDTRVAPNPQQPNLSALFYSSSADGGFTWSPAQQIGPAYNHLVGFPQQNKLGDYYDMHSDNVGASLAYAATYNGEQDVYFKRIGDYDCNGNGVGDLLDISGGASQDVDNDGNPDECECIGDANGSNGVDLADLSLTLGAFGTCLGQPGYLAGADFNRDNCVDLADLAALLANFGRACPT
jgi:hypothetical protein